MTLPALARALSLCAFALFLSFAPPAAADCTESRVKKLSKQGKTIAAIAKTCEMSKKEVQSMLEEEEDEDEGKLPKGAPVGQCGCWGPIDPSHRQPEPSCKSGVARPKMCSAMCSMGGYMWRGVCT